jgi:hypothetical protein
MASRTVRKRLHRQVTRLAGLGAPARLAESRWYLTRWRAEARCRAASLGEPAVWKLEAEARPRALALDPSGELAADLARVCAEAVEWAAERRLLGVSRPPADRARVRHVGTRG